jgi:predicted alpha/beta-fold hydrolase
MPPFRPLPLLGGPHAQTILGYFWPGPRCPRGRRLVVPLDDGDALLLHENTPRGWVPGDPVALLVHGLTGTAQSGHCQRLARHLLPAGFRTYRIDMRGAGEGVCLARRTYHAGRSDDLRAAVQVIRGRCPGSRVGVLAISLGGNASLKLAGEGGPIDAVAAINPPIDLERCSQRFQRPANRFYERRFVRDLLRNVAMRRQAFPELPAYELHAEMSLRAFDDRYTAPVNGFRDAGHYYAEASSLGYIARIAVPALILTARDDPFVDPAPFESLCVPETVRVCITPQGGHVGFISAEGQRWAERVVADWLIATLGRG